MNPIHHDTEFAKGAGFPGPFAVGMLQAGVLATYVTDWLGAASVRRFKVQFREQAWPGDVLTYAGTVVAQAGGGGAPAGRPRARRHPPDRRHPPQGLGHRRSSTDDQGRIGLTYPGQTISSATERDDLVKIDLPPKSS